jgi:tripartite-type tricarboxylate transporter receptor subunit TctC
MTAQPVSLSAIVAAAVCTLLVDPAAGQPNPGRQIKMVVPVAPGGPFDTLARAMAEQIGRAQGATMLIENRPGGGSVIASEAVSRAAPDGSTILFMANSFVINPHMKKLNYDPLTSFEPICYLVRSPHVLVVSPASPYRTLADLVGAARAKPGELTLAANGPASGQHFGFEILKRAANFNMTFVPYSGSAPAVTALLGAHITAALADYSTVAAHIKSGALRALAVGAPTRIEALPDVPAIAESYADVESEGWLGIVAPAKTPPETVTQLTAWFTAALRAPDVKERLVSQGLFPVATCGADFGAFIRKHHDEYGRIVREAGIKAQ